MHWSKDKIAPNPRSVNKFKTNEIFFGLTSKHSYIFCCEL